MEIIVTPTKDAQRGMLTWGRKSVPCALGRTGIRVTKKEGDGATPTGTFPLRRLFFRPDRRARPATSLPATAITSALGWCDDPQSPLYNRLVRLPYPLSHETLAREDHLYDLMVVLGHNDAPPIPGAGSAIFLHLAKDGYAPTEGCVALAPDDMVDLLAVVGQSDVLTIRRK